MKYFCKYSFSRHDTFSHFLKNLTSVKLGEDTVYGKGVEGSDAVYYVVAEDNKSLTLHNVKPGTYTVKIAAEYYDDALETGFTMPGTVEVKAVPEMKVTSSEKDGVFTVSIQGVKDEVNNTTTDRQIDEWKSKVQTISVQDTQYDKIADFSFAAPSKTSTNYEFKIGSYSDTQLVLGGGAFKDGENTVTISAEGYEDKEITVTKQSEPEEQPAPVLSATAKSSYGYYNVTLTSTDDLSQWWEKVQTITVDDDTAKAQKSSYSTGTVKLSNANLHGMPDSLQPVIRMRLSPLLLKRKLLRQSLPLLRSRMTTATKSRCPAPIPVSMPTGGRHFPKSR